MEREWHSEKDSSSIIVTEGGIVISESELHLEKQFDSITVTDGGIVTFERDKGFIKSLFLLDIILNLHAIFWQFFVNHSKIKAVVCFQYLNIYNELKSFIDIIIIGVDYVLFIDNKKNELFV